MSGKPLAGRVALVTGATRTIGIGAAISRRLATDGADIAFTHYSAYDNAMYDAPTGGPEDLQAELEALGVRVLPIGIDLSQAGIAGGLFDQVEAGLGKVDILVNNAAYSTNDGWEDLTEETLDKHLFTNTRATVMLTVEFARRFSGSAGRVVNFSSGQHLGPMPNELSYATSKGGIIAFSTSLAPALMAKGITVNVVNPGPTDTGWMTPELAEVIAGQIPGGRAGVPDDAARLVGWLVSDEAMWVTGQVINSEGGMIRS